MKYPFSIPLVALATPSGGGDTPYVRISFAGLGGSNLSIYGNDYGHSDNAHRFGIITATSGFLPAARQTSATSPLNVTDSSHYGTYAGWYAFADSSSWTSGTGDSSPWVKVQFPAGVITATSGAITALQILDAGTSSMASSIKIEVSPTGVFGGEQTLVKQWTGLTWSGGLVVRTLTV